MPYTKKTVVAGFCVLVAVKEKKQRTNEMNAFQKANRIKNLGVEIESMQFEFAYNQNDMFEDSKFLEDMYEQCATTENGVGYHMQTSSR